VLPTIPVVTVSAINNTGYTLSWTATNAFTFDLINTGNDAVYALSKSPLRNITITGLTPNTTYNPVVSSYGIGNGPIAAAAVSVKTLNQNPVVPVVTATAITNTGFTLAWNSSAVIAGTYDVTIDDRVVASKISAISYTVTDLSAGTLYTCGVKAYGATPVQSLSIPVTTTRVLPGYPTITVSAITATGYTLAWSSAGTAYYDIVTGNGAQDLSGTTGTTAIITGLTPGTAYNVMITAYGYGGTGPAITNMVITTLASPLATPVITFSAITNTSYTISWTAAGAVSYSLDTTGNILINDTSPILTNSVVVSGLTPGTTYTPVVTAEGYDGATKFATKSVTTSNVTPTVPVITITNGGPYGFNASWTCAGASYYTFNIKDTLGNELSGTSIQPIISANQFITSPQGFDLQPLMNYTLTVVAYTGTGKTSSASKSYFTPSVPGTITNLRCISTVSNALTYSWTQIGLDYLEISVTYDGEEVFSASNINPNLTTAEIINLDSDRLYCFNLTGRSGSINTVSAQCFASTSSLAAGNATFVNYLPGVIGIFHV
jgi:hypothetical protein